MDTPSSHLDLSVVKEIFGQAVDIADGQREAFILERCRGDENLLREVRRLLKSHDRATGFLDQPTLDSRPGIAKLLEPRLPEHIGPYKVLRRLGEGGFGCVYLSEQEHPVRRQVAIKVLKFGVESRQTLARFDAERQALALMNHPNIAHVYDAGATDDNRPYFVMEVVSGVPITQFADQRRLSTVERLKLIIDVCHAVQHAHQKGVIHRDIKPSNVLVVEDAGRGVPKVIDFGVAKASLATHLTEFTPVTEDRQLVGTPEYMSPEQASSGGADIDTRSDVYSVGVLMYELLTGATPFDPQSLRQKSLAEMQRIIAQDEPPRMSQRAASGSDGSLTLAARSRAPLLRGELDWIAMKCLEKDRARRYDSAAAIAADILNYLDGKPVLAGPPTRIYRMTKFVRRNKVPVGGAAIVLVAIIGGLVATSLSLRQAKVERDRAVAARSAEATARSLAEHHVSFVREMFDSISPEQAQGRQVSVREVLDTAAARVEGSFRGEPLAEASIRDTFGLAYLHIGLLDRSRQEYQRALQLLQDSGKADTPEAITLQARLGEVEKERGDFKASEALLRSAYASARSKLGMANPRTLVAADALAVLLLKINALDEAEKIRADAAPLVDQVLGPATPSALTFHTNYAVLRHTQGRFAEAEAMYRESLAVARKALGDLHPDTIALKFSIATLLRDQARFKLSLEMMEDCLKSSRQVFGEDHPVTLANAHQTALLMSANMRTPEAEKLLEATIEKLKRVLGEDHLTTLYARHDLVQIRFLSSRGTNQESELVDLIDRMKRVVGENHRDTLMFRADLARLCAGRGDLPAAERIYADVLPRMAATMGPEHPYTLSIQMRLGSVIGRQGRWQDARPMLEHVYQQKHQQGETARDWSSAVYYGVCLEHLGQYADAVPVLLVAEAAMKTYPKLDRVQMQQTARALSACYEKLGQADKSAAYRQTAENLTASLATQPARH